MFIYETKVLPQRETSSIGNIDIHLDYHYLNIFHVGDTKRDFSRKVIWFQ